MNQALYKKAAENLYRYWGFDSFRSGQEEAVRAVLQGEDVLVLFPTGGGKSICYQLPATVLEGLTLVISPLVSLMQDQVQQLKDRGISATFLNSTLSHREKEQRLVNARNGMYDLLYCSPERLQTTLWKAELPELDIEVVAIDEAHCISEWGHDFRKEYREIRPSLESIAERVTWIALTATATPEVRKDIQQNLGLANAHVIAKGFDRPNLKWWVSSTAKKEQKLLAAVKKADKGGSGLIYAGTRRNCEEISAKVQSRLGITAKPYHAGIEGSERKKIQEEWISGTVPLVVATSAFGMGIDKADCRYVIHYQMPYSLESYYQEAGRAGRDGKESFPLLLFNKSDALIAEKRIKDSYPQMKQLQHVYDALCDHLNLAVGSEMEKAQEVPIRALEKRASFKRKTVRSALDILQQLGILQLIEPYSTRLGIHFVASPDYIRELIHTIPNQKKAAFLDTLFRQFGGTAFEEMNYLELEYLQHKLETTPVALKKGLQVLQDRDQILKFEILGEHSLVMLEDERQSELRLNQSELDRHRDHLLLKLEYMKQYISSEGCREVFIRHYFGEQGLEPCGHCDNCLKKDKKENESTSSIEEIRQLLHKEPHTLNQISRRLNGTPSHHKKMIKYLIREDKVEVKGDQYFWKKD